MGRLLKAVSAGIFVAACGGVRDAFTPHVETVARAAGYELTVEQLGQLFSTARSLPLRPDVVERSAHLWVDYVLFADRVLAGDSMLDSVRVVAARWPDVQSALIERLHANLVAARGVLDSAQLDSVYRAGEYRLIRHILLRADPSLSPAAREGKRRQAEALRARLAAGGSWAQANALSEDSLARARGGEIGVIARGETVEPFENVAFALEPGEISQVTETPYGFHVLTRPPLEEVRSSYRAAVERRLSARADSVYLAQLVERRKLAVRSSAPSALREAVREPLLSRESKTVLAEYAGGKFTVGDFMRWLDVLPPQLEDQIGGASDQQLVSLVRSLAQNELLVSEAEAAGASLTDGEMAELKAGLAAEIAQVRSALKLDTIPEGVSGDREARKRLVEEKVMQYFDVFANDLPQLVPVPRFLADRLREEQKWRVFPAGVRRAYERATQLRASLDSAAGRTPAIVPPGAGIR
ncbi:Foldase protein PrsA 3 [bacterium HR33]|nr:Foldase protein PrsA 3 [bacterium HR33]